LRIGSIGDDVGDDIIAPTPISWKEPFHSEQLVHERTRERSSTALELVSGPFGQTSAW
jgi:hypothetical protein